MSLDRFGVEGKPLRVAYLINQYPKVSHSFIRREILALERQGVEVLRFAHRGWDAELVDPEDQRERVRTTYLLRGSPLKLIATALTTCVSTPFKAANAVAEALRMNRRSDRGLVHRMAYFAQACKLLGLLRNSGVRHLHAHFGTNSAEVAMLARLLGGPPFSFTVHGPEEFDKPESLHLARKAQRARFVVAISSFGRSQLWRLLPAAQWPKVKVVHCGLDQTFTQAPANAEGLQTSTLICVGRLCEQKGQLLLIPAIKALRDAGVEVRLVLAGDGEMRREVEAEIARCGLQAFVRITGWISSDQVRREISAARALVLPSFAEGLPVVIMEALALGRPVISTFVAGIPELVTPDVGWLVPAGDMSALVRAMQECLEASATHLDEMGIRGRAQCLSRHDADLEGRKLIDIINKVLSSEE